MKLNLSSILLPAALLMLSAGCKKYDYTQNLENYHDNIVFVEDKVTGSTFLSNEGQIKVQGDLAAYSYILKLNNFQLYAGAPLRSATISNLTQYYQEKGESEEDKYTPLYYLFRQEAFTRTAGDMDVTDMRYGYLSGTYWLSFGSDGRYNVWATPRARTLYANYNLTQSPVAAGFCVEDALHPGYKFTVDPERRTITVKGNGVKLRQDETDPSKTLEFRTFEWVDIPVDFSSTGYSFYVDELIPNVNGEAAPEFKITNLRGEIAFDYEGRKAVTYKILNGQGQNMSVESRFDLLPSSNM